MDSIELKNFWEQVKNELLENLPESAHPWISLLEISDYDKGVLTVVTGQSMGRNILKSTYYSKIIEILKT